MPTTSLFQAADFPGNLCLGFGPLLPSVNESLCVLGSACHQQPAEAEAAPESNLSYYLIWPRQWREVVTLEGSRANLEVGVWREFHRWLWVSPQPPEPHGD